MPRTSLSDPLQIAVVSETLFRGSLGVTFAPGKNDAASPGGAWVRDLKTDLDALIAWSAAVVVTLIEPHEFEQLAIPTLGEEIRARGIDWLHLPIRDVDVPDTKLEQAWPAHSAELRRRLRAGHNVIVHCRGGLGRAGMVAARLLVEEGVPTKMAIKAVREARTGAIETYAQEEWVRRGAKKRRASEGRERRA